MLTIRTATPADVPAIVQFIHDLAEYERSLPECQVTEADLLRDGFGLAADARTPLTPVPALHFRALLADWQEDAAASAQPAGFALFFTSYSTWVGHHGIRLEDIYVRPELRGRGIGKALFAALARVAVDEGCSRLEWDVLTWNEPAIGFYRGLGAVVKNDWHVMRLAGEPLVRLANKTS